jgi:hypothetical protein
MDRALNDANVLVAMHLTFAILTPAIEAVKRTVSLSGCYEVLSCKIFIYAVAVRGSWHLFKM